MLGVRSVRWYSPSHLVIRRVHLPAGHRVSGQLSSHARAVQCTCWEVDVELVDVPDALD